jgi:hypothetical protein
MRARAVRFLLGAAILIAPARPGLAAERAAALETPHFAFHSDFETNLNDALVAAGVDRKFRRPELFHSGPEAACFEALPPSARAGWDGALDYYARIVSPGSFHERPQYVIRVQLAGFDEELGNAADRELASIAAAFRAAAAPAYRACRWPAQDEANRRFLESLRPRLAAYEDKVAARLTQLYQKPWSGLPIPVDLVQTVSWAGANSIVRDAGGGHLLVSVENPEASALEVVFHEASHLLMTRNAPVSAALDRAAAAAGIPQPKDLWHVVLFFTTGETVRRILEEGGVAGYTPMVYGIFARGDWVELREPVEKAWIPYLDGKTKLPEAASDLIEACRKTAPERG